MADHFLFSVLLLVVFVGLISACTNPQVTSKSFTTQDATIVTHIGFISEFEVKCSSGDISSLYAELPDGSIIPAAVVGTNKYQVSWTEDTKTAAKGTHKIRIFEEDGYAALRKVLRGNEATSSVSEFFNISVVHPGAYSGPWLRSEFIAVIASLFVSYFAVTKKGKIVA
ncbi:unnamed protein product [Ceutorhynchus assimilis]|uniref:Translocon-associated protein subunit delta n=1 Tax=Ceutorhynchus assimilis TaxID=467358 RepID=A0A9N9QIS9_9CUCU|nr:unnamed protein product [Ceutorhynchus assimilis]